MSVFPRNDHHSRPTGGGYPRGGGGAKRSPRERLTRMQAIVETDLECQMDSSAWVAAGAEPPRASPQYA